MLDELISVKLTSAQLDLLIDTLEDCNDCGPHYDGWQSMELVSLKNTIESYKKESANVS